MKVRQATLKDFEKINELNAVCYGFDPITVSERFLKRYEYTFDEQYCIEIDEKVVANARCVPLEQNIRGKWVRMGGIAMVVSDPEMRRKGFVREIMNYLLELMYEEKYGVSTLYPFKDTFYAAFGYVNTPPTVRMEFNPKLLGRWKDLPQGYTVKRLSQVNGFPIYKEIHGKAVDNIHGAAKRSEKRWKEYDTPGPGWYAIAYNHEGKPEGAMKYFSKGFSTGFEWAEEGQIQLSEFWALTPKARQTLYHFLYLYSDQIMKVKIPIDPNESEFYTWLQGYFTTSLSPINIWMSRIINIKRSLDDIHVTKVGNLKIKVIDEQIPQNNQTYELTSEKNKLKVEELGEKQADITLTIQGLTSLLYGLLKASDLESFNWITEHKLEHIDLLNNWFPLKTPYMIEGF